MEDKKPVWKAHEDQKIIQEKEREKNLALFYLKEWLDKHQIQFSENQKGNLINIHSDQLISRKEIVKLLNLTKGYLGIQFHQGEIGIYELFSKIKQ